MSNAAIADVSVDARSPEPTQPGAPCERCHVGTPSDDLYDFEGDWLCEGCCEAIERERDATEPCDDADDDEPREPEPVDEDELLEDDDAAA